MTRHSLDCLDFIFQAIFTMEVRQIFVKPFLVCKRNNHSPHFISDQNRTNSQRSSWRTKQRTIRILVALEIKLLITILIVLPNCKTRRERISKRFDELLQEVILIIYPVKFRAFAVIENGTWTGIWRMLAYKGMQMSKIQCRYSICVQDNQMTGRLVNHWPFTPINLQIKCIHTGLAGGTSRCNCTSFYVQLKK